MSKQDTRFFNTFSLVIGLLVVVALGLFALARSVAGETQEKQMLVESHYLKGVDERVAAVCPRGRGRPGQFGPQDRVDDPRRVGAAPRSRRTAMSCYEQACKAMPWRRHRRLRRRRATRRPWGPRVAKGKDVLY